MTLNLAGIVLVILILVGLLIILRNRTLDNFIVFLDDVVIPKTITTIDSNTIEVTFNYAVAGYANVSKGGHFVSGSVNYTNVGSDIVPALNNTYNLGSPDYQWKHVYISTGSLYINGINILSLNQDNQVVIGGTQVFNTTASTGSINSSFTGELKLDSDLVLENTGSNVQSRQGVLSQDISGDTTLIDLADYNSATFDYVVINGSNMRAGNIASVWNGSISSHNEINTTDLGNTYDLSFDVTSDGKLNALVANGTWTVQINYKAIGNINL